MQISSKYGSVACSFHSLLIRVFQIIFIFPYGCLSLTRTSQFVRLKILWDYSCHNIIFKLFIRMHSLMTIIFLHQIINSPSCIMIKSILWDTGNNRRMAFHSAILGLLNFLLIIGSSYHASFSSIFYIILYYGPGLDGRCSLYFYFYQQYLSITFVNLQHIHTNNQEIIFKCSSCYCFITVIDHLDWRTTHQVFICQCSCLH